jgi:chromosome segregation ATPase
MKLFSSQKSPTEVEITTRQLSQLSALVHEETKKLNELRDTIRATRDSLDEWERTEKQRILRDINDLKNEVAQLEARKAVALEPTELKEQEVAQREEQVNERERVLHEKENKLIANLTYCTHKESELKKLEQELTVESERIQTQRTSLLEQEHDHKTRIESAYNDLQRDLNQLKVRTTHLDEQERLIAHREKVIEAQQKTIQDLSASLDTKKTLLDKRANKLRKQYEDRRK